MDSDAIAMLVYARAHLPSCVFLMHVGYIFVLTFEPTYYATKRIIMTHTKYKRNLRGSSMATTEHLHSRLSSSEAGLGRTR